MNLIKCYINQSNWLKAKPKKITVRGVLWHSTGANNTNLKRYIQPDDNAPDRDKLLNIIGKNPYNNDWNHINRDAGVSFFIGKLADGSVATIQCGPDDITQWGCGGSLNNTHIQFEKCEDGLNDKSYFDKVYKEARELTAYLCKKYNLNPESTFTYYRKTVPVIIDHAGSYKLGMGSNHADIGHWFRKYLGDNYLDAIRKDVQKELKGECEDMGCPYWKNGKCTKPAGGTTPAVPVKKIEKGSLVKITGTTYYNGKTIPQWVRNQKWYVLQINGDRVVIDENEAKTNHIMSAVSLNNLALA